jgi:K+/H+ antiporter YhaU regulatory subunit KhtT
LFFGRELKEAMFRTNYGATVHAIRHRGETMRDDVETTLLYPGDVLLIGASRGVLEALSRFLEMS